MNRFFLSQDEIKDQVVHFPPDIAHQIVHVLRLGDGEEVQVLDNQGSTYLVRIQLTGGPNPVIGQIVSKAPASGEPKTKVSLCFGLANRDKVELILQKATEVGVSAFYPFVSSRTLVQSTTLVEKRRERWERIIREAAEQSGRGRLPALHSPMALEGCLKVVKENHSNMLVAWEGAEVNKGYGLSSTLKSWVESLAVFVGPEGGFSNDEMATFRSFDCQMVSLGARILRMETAAIVFPALVLHRMGDL